MGILVSIALSVCFLKTPSSGCCRELSARKMLLSRLQIVFSSPYFLFHARCIVISDTGNRPLYHEIRWMCSPLIHWHWYKPEFGLLHCPRMQPQKPQECATANQRCPKSAIPAWLLDNVMGGWIICSLPINPHCLWFSIWSVWKGVIISTLFQLSCWKGENG